MTNNNAIYEKSSKFFLHSLNLGLYLQQRLHTPFGKTSCPVTIVQLEVVGPLYPMHGLKSIRFKLDFLHIPLMDH